MVCAGFIPGCSVGVRELVTGVECWWLFRVYVSRMRVCCVLCAGCCGGWHGWQRAATIPGTTTPRRGLLITHEAADIDCFLWQTDGVVGSSALA